MQYLLAMCSDSQALTIHHQLFISIVSHLKQQFLYCHYIVIPNIDSVHTILKIKHQNSSRPNFPNYADLKLSCVCRPGTSQSRPDTFDTH